MVQAHIVALAGDGIGPEIMASGLAVLKAVADRYGHQFTIEEKDFGGAAIDSQGHPYPQATKRAVHQADAILLGAIGGPQYDQSAVTPEQGILMLRQDLGLFCNLRPIKVPQATVGLSPLKADIVSGTDFVVVRELTGGAYFGHKEEGTDYASDLMPYSKTEVERVAKVAFEMAQSRRCKLTSVDKANVLASSRLWRHTVSQMASQYPDVELSHEYVDAMAMKLVTKPNAYDVILTENLFGDILSDEASVLTGSLGMNPSSSRGQSGLSLYEPIHGSAPDIAGQDLANPMSMILSVTAMLRESFGLVEEAETVEKAAYALIETGIKTSDLGGKYKTSEFTEYLLKNIKN
ncbi:3-isopropylmalate dehydrogenase [Aerococcus urinaehominis]|uniref:3-isopropylmalate dehydrogenase n=1 Tax=Aerococcus urinaehominis TaxID=128944 RepID=A0A0X8FK30_9LACT|nr:3-isopropylmalate dehydrogenase [Aerococcus urinaehominis]AMB98778.1 3-isopropylmalate dehydrogenase [Aerococcus urinaehominis]SDM13004.1 3-isopropylmalate dehydrogenase [Aerococcus urinaehominis]